MEIIIIPNIHPVIVHFSVALLTTSMILFLVAYARGKTGKDEKLLYTARLVFWLGMGAILLTVLAGIQAYGTVEHDSVSHGAMTDHRNWAFGAFALYLITAFMVWRERKGGLGMLSLICLIVASLTLVTVAYKGGHLVYKYGLGVQSLPEKAGADHDHEHAEDADHDDAPEITKSAPNIEKKDDGHSHSHDDHASPEIKGDPAQIADALYAALVEGDDTTVGKLLSENIVILEGGHAQKSRDEYMSGHMKSDMAFLPNINREIISREVSQSDGLAWVITHSRSTGTYKGKELNFTSREMLVMRHNGTAWQITLIHWADS